MSSKVYDVLKYVQRIFLPAFGTFYGAMANVWGWPCATEVVTSIAAIATFLGALLEVSSYQYKKRGEIE